MLTIQREARSPRNFASLLEQSLASAVLTMPSAADGIALESAVAYAIALRDGGSQKLSDSIERLSTTGGQVADSLGHRRPVYRPIWLYAIAQAIRIGGQVPPVSLRQAITTLAAETSIDWSAANGQRAAEAAWSALARFAVNNLIGSRLPEPLFEQMVHAQQPDGSWLHAGAADNIETRGYDELVLLHAITSYAVITNRSDLRPAIAANAAFHSRELQPDHATHQPWAMHALAAAPATLPLAEQLLHAAQAQQPTGLHGLPVVLLADALYGLRSSSFFCEPS